MNNKTVMSMYFKSTRSQAAEAVIPSFSYLRLKTNK